MKRVRVSDDLSKGRARYANAGSILPGASVAVQQRKTDKATPDARWMSALSVRAELLHDLLELTGHALLCRPSSKLF